MNGRLPLLGLALLFAGTASGATVQDHRCLTGGRNGSIHLEWRWLEDGQSDVRYAGQRKRLPLRRISMQSTVLAEDRPYQFDSVWEERIDGRLNGRYLLSTQGALVLDLRYERARDGRRSSFHDDVEGVRPALCRFRQPDRGAARGASGMTRVSGNAALRSVTLGNLSFLVTPSEACMSLFRRKSLDSVTVHEAGRRLIPTLSWPHLIALGIGAIVGTGIYTLIGVGANLAGPAVLISFAIAGAVCACAALSYAELSTMMPAAGSAYTYSYSALGEVFAWVVGWSLILEYSLVVSTVAVGWSGYFVGFLEWVHTQFGWNVHLPAWLAAGPHVEGGMINLPAIIITWLVAGMLMAGTKESATLNAILVVFKLIALAIFVAVALPAFDSANLQPFMPYGFAKSMGPDGVEHGVMAAAAIIFFAFYGFDAISTAAEETKNPGRDLSIGIIGSMIGCTIVYVLVALAAVGAMSYAVFGHSAEPLALIMRQLGHPTAAMVIGVIAIIALPTVLLAFLYGQSRIFFVMSRDGLLPRGLSKVNARTGTPVATTLFTAVVVSALAGVARLDEIAALANAGTLAAFTAVGICLVVLRLREPNRERTFRTPVAFVVGPLAALGCIYLFISLPHTTQLYFLLWNVVGLVLYFLYSRRHALIAK